MASGVFTLEQMADTRSPGAGAAGRDVLPSPRSQARSRSSRSATRVEAGQTVCIVEAMKMMNEVVAGESGKVAEIAAENGEWVEFEQVLMYLEPSEA